MFVSRLTEARETWRHPALLHLVSLPPNMYSLSCIDSIIDANANPTAVRRYGAIVGETKIAAHTPR